MTRPSAGDVWRYPYLWKWQQLGGETEGRKDRPVAVVITLRDANAASHVILLALTTQPPGKDRLCISVPRAEKRLAGLDSDRPVWLMLDEYNHDILEISPRFDPSARIGRFSDRFVQHLAARFAAALREGAARRIGRED
ncbi:MAG: hypothetical protein ACKVPY_06885 [Paracoccaceae bacterium]